MAPLLSICIPTHHGRAATLATALDSVLRQLPEPRSDIEIVVCDNASADGTADIVAERSRHHPDTLSYHRHRENVGFARNLIAAAERAKGRHFWLLGSDDAIAPGGLTKVLQTLRANPQINGVSVNRRNFDATLTRPARSDAPTLLGQELQAQPRSYDAARPALEDLGLYLTYISGQIVSRDQFVAIARAAPAAVVEPGYYLHLYVFTRMLMEQPRWRWEPQQVVHNRTHNDAHPELFDHQAARSQVVLMRDRAVVWAAAVGPRTELYDLLTRRCRAFNASPRSVLGCKLGANHTLREDRLLLRNLGRHYCGDPRFWLVSLPALLAPHQAAKLLSRLVRSAESRRSCFAPPGRSRRKRQRVRLP